MSENPTSAASAQADIDAIEKMMKARKEQSGEATAQEPQPEPDAAAVAQQAEQLAAAKRQQQQQDASTAADAAPTQGTPADAPAPPRTDATPEPATAQPAPEAAAPPQSEMPAPDEADDTEFQQVSSEDERTEPADQPAAQPVEEPIKAADTTTTETPDAPAEPPHNEQAQDEQAQTPAVEDIEDVEPPLQAATEPRAATEPEKTAPEKAAPSSGEFTFKDAIVDLVEKQKHLLEEQTYEANCRAENLAEQWGNFIQLNEDIAQLGMVFRREAAIALQELGFAPDAETI
jgi:hypothetical protein